MYGFLSLSPTVSFLLFTKNNILFFVGSISCIPCANCSTRPEAYHVHQECRACSADDTIIEFSTCNRGCRPTARVNDVPLLAMYWAYTTPNLIKFLEYLLCKSVVNYAVQTNQQSPAFTNLGLFDMTYMLKSDANNEDALKESAQYISLLPNMIKYNYMHNKDALDELGVLDSKYVDPFCADPTATTTVGQNAFTQISAVQWINVNLITGATWNRLIQERSLTRPTYQRSRYDTVAGAASSAADTHLLIFNFSTGTRDTIVFSNVILTFTNASVTRQLSLNATTAFPWSVNATNKIFRYQGTLGQGYISDVSFVGSVTRKTTFALTLLHKYSTQNTEFIIAATLLPGTEKQVKACNENTDDDDQDFEIADPRDYKLIRDQFFDKLCAVSISE